MMTYIGTSASQWIRLFVRVFMCMCAGVYVYVGMGACEFVYECVRYCMCMYGQCMRWIERCLGICVLHVYVCSFAYRKCVTCSMFNSLYDDVLYTYTSFENDCVIENTCIQHVSAPLIIVILLHVCTWRETLFVLDDYLTWRHVLESDHVTSMQTAFTL